MEFREIRVFLAVCEELHFGRAAERLYVSPTRVSQTVRAIEAGIGGKLFERTSRRVHLTPLGEMLRDGVQPVHDHLAQVLREVRAAARGVTGELRLGLYSPLVGGPLIVAVIRSYEEHHPGSRVVLHDRSIADGLDDLRRGDLDLIASWLPLDEPDMTIGPTLTCEQRALAVPAGHRLATRGHAWVEDLGDCDVIDRPGLPPVMRDVLVPRTTPGGRPIRRRYRTDNSVESLTFVARGSAVHPTVASAAAYMPFPGVTYVPLRGLPPLRSAVVWRSAAVSAAVRAFSHTARRVAHASA